ncbi:MAG: amidophosphoribosyltransferase [Candidatus Omnitrophota bacterium]
MYASKADRIKDECGLFGVFGNKDAAELTHVGLFALQHRGEESAGIAVSDGKNISCHKDMGLVGDVFNEKNLKPLKGRVAIGHVRYSTTGSSVLTNAQPHVVSYSKGQVAVAHNGNLVNAKQLREKLEQYGSIFQSTMDSEIIVHLMAKPSYKNKVDSICGAVRQIKGAFSLVLLTENALIGVRDPHGFRPLVLGKRNGAWFLASETCALDLVGAQYVRDVQPGEIVVIDKKGVNSLFPFSNKNGKTSFCIFEHIYFSRPDSRVFGNNVGKVRAKLGMQLARECPADADVVIAVPDSGNFAAIGFAKETDIPFGIGFVRNHYIGRTFISPVESMREFKVKIKINPIADFIKGKRLVVVDDSIVRGNTAKSRVKVLRKAGAKEVHLRISCPPHRFPCHYGIDFPNKEELIANNMSVKEIEKYLGVDSLGYLSWEGMMSSITEKKDRYCTACFNGKYSVKFDNHCTKHSLE